MKPQRTFKFLATGAYDAGSGVTWPVPSQAEPGAWHEAGEQRDIIVCRAGDLAYWLHEELWETEYTGESQEGADCLVVRRARLLRRIERWHSESAIGFAHACVQHAAELLAQADAEARARAAGYLEDAQYCANDDEVSFAAFGAAVTVGKLGSPADAEDAYRRERAWQTVWLQRHIIDDCL